MGEIIEDLIFAAAATALGYVVVTRLLPEQSTNPTGSATTTTTTCNGPTLGGLCLGSQITTTAPASVVTGPSANPTTPNPTTSPAHSLDRLAQDILGGAAWGLGPIPGIYTWITGWS